MQKNYIVSFTCLRFVLSQTEFDSLLDSSTPQSTASIVSTSDNKYTVINTSNANNDKLIWNITNLSGFPKGVSDLILSGYATGISAAITPRRNTAYCDHMHTSIGARFELRAELTYSTGNKEFYSSFDPNIKSRQFIAVPVTFNEDANGNPILPSAIKIIVDFTGNSFVASKPCVFDKPMLAKGDWVYAEFDDNDNKTEEWYSEKSVEKTSNGTKTGNEIRLQIHKLFSYDSRNNSIEEKVIENKVVTNKRRCIYHACG